MKKILIIALAAGTLVSCDALKDKGTFDVPQVTTESLLNGATFAQYDAVTNEDGTTSYTPSADGNYIQYSFPSVNAVTAYYIKADGSQSVLDYGKNAGMFYFRPSRGSEPVQNVYFKYIDADLKEVTVSKEFTLQVAQELAAGDKLMCSNNGQKAWLWFPTNVNGGAVWGNAGYQAGAMTNPSDISGAWWGCGTIDGDANDKFDSQLGHSANGALTGEEYMDSKMVFTEDGEIVKYSYTGEELGRGTWALKDYDGGAAIDDNGNVAYLETSAGAILWPWMINSADHFEPTRFEVAYLSVDHMTLIYAPEGTGAWSECTWWSFYNVDDATGILSAEKWGWYPTTVNGGACWGNGGYLAGAQSDPNNINGAWWGCGPIDSDCANTFADQMGHSAVGDATGEEYFGSYMLFSDEEGTMGKYDPEGNLLGEGTWEVDMTPNEANFSIGTLKTSAGAILWPWMINSAEHYEPTEFEIGWLDGSNMILIYAPEGTGAWAECTWWSFGKLAE